MNSKYRKLCPAVEVGVIPFLGVPGLVPWVIGVCGHWIGCQELRSHALSECLVPART